METGRARRSTGRCEQRSVGKRILLEERDQGVEVKFLAEETLEVRGELLDAECPTELDGRLKPVPKNVPETI
jgi:hypothetical protein